MDATQHRHGLSKRVPAHTVAAFFDQRGHTQGTLWDLSRTGALLSTANAVRPGSKGTLKVKSYRSRTELSFSCQVARVATLPNVGIGLSFTGMGLASLLWLNNYCAFFHERRRVVMIDSDSTALTTMERILTTEGYKFIGIETADNCEAAIARIQPSMIMIDALQAKGGVLNQLRRRPEIATTPLLLCSDADGPDVSDLGIPVVQKRAWRDEIVNAVRFVAKETAPTLA